MTVIKDRHVDVKQYSLEYNKPHFRKRDVSPHTYAQLQNKSNKKSLEDTVSFKGFQVAGKHAEVKNSFVPLIIKPPKELVQKVFKTLENVSTEQHKYYDEIRKNFINLVKTDEKFCKKYGINKDIALNISKDNLYFIPRDQVATKFIKNLFSPVTYVVKKTANLFIDKNSTLNIVFF